jgi:HSP20 family protein
MPHKRSDWISDMDVMQQRMERLLTHISTSKPPRVHFSPRVWAPLVDVYETPEEVVVLVDLAGVTKDELNIALDHDDLIIRGERQDKRPEKRRTYYQMEITCGPFERRIHLPATVDSERRPHPTMMVLSRSYYQKPRRRRFIELTSAQNKDPEKSVGGDYGIHSPD